MAWLKITRWESGASHICTVTDLDVVGQPDYPFRMERFSTASRQGIGRYAPIKDYGAIGDGRAVALVSLAGSIDWLCLPHFSSPSLFAALLDERRGGRFAVRPTTPFDAVHRYVPNTNVLETRFVTETGSVAVIDCMAMLEGPDHPDYLRPQAEILRVIRGAEGYVDLEIVCEPRPDFARANGRFESRGRLGWAYCCGGQVAFVQSEIPLEASKGQVQGGTRVSAGETRCVSLAYTRRDIGVVPTLGSDAIERLEDTRRWWEGWTRICRFEGPFRDEIVRSALVLKLLQYDLSGAVVAAPTSSLPERLGGIRNWDYRYCWLRDAALTLQAFVDLGYTAEAKLFLDWLLHTTRLSWPRLDVLYDVYGETHVPEHELEEFEGYCGSRPVRIGNDACKQLQLDVYGSVVQAAYEFVERGGELDSPQIRALVGFGRQVCKLWREPDEGIWEKRADRMHHTYSKMMCWVALDRLLRMADKGMLRAPVGLFRRERDRIEEAVERRGFNERLNSYVAVFDGDTPDVSLLLAARCGYRSAEDARMRGTFAYIERTLAVGDMLYRYPLESDGLPGGEGAFGIASFWAVEYLALAGRADEAHARFGRLLEKASDLGLFAEEIDPETGAGLGNYPQAFTHVGLITAAMALRRAGTAGRAVLSEPGLR